MLSDSSVLCNFADAGQAHLDALLAYCGDDLYVTQGVAKELRRLGRDKSPRLKPVMEEWPDERIFVLAPELELNVANVLKLYNRLERFIDKDRGEVETAFYANDEYRRQRQTFDVLMDDGWGRSLVADDLRIFDSSEMACYLVLAGLLDEEQGWEIYSEANKYAEREKYKSLLEEIESTMT